MIFTWNGWMLLWFNFKPFWLVLMCGGWDLFSALACCHPHVKSCSKCGGTRFYFWCRQNHEELFSWLHLMESNKTQGRGWDYGSWTVQKGMSQEINLTETIHELPEEWACICSEQEEDDGFFPYCQPSHGHLSRAMASPIWTMMKQWPFNRTVSALLTFIVILPASQKWHHPSHSSPASVLVLGAHSCVTG